MGDAFTETTSDAPESSVTAIIPPSEKTVVTVVEVPPPHPVRTNANKIKSRIIMGRETDDFTIYSPSIHLTGAPVLEFRPHPPYLDRAITKRFHNNNSDLAVL